MNHILNNIGFNNIGFNGPFILIIFTIYLLWNKENLLFYYIVGIFTNMILNVVLKGIIQEPRPIFEDKKVSLATSHAKRFFYQNGIPFELFGMPSGHTQSTFFSTIFIYLSLKKMNITYIYLLITLITSIQRISSNYHTISQVLVGTLVGSFFALFVYNFAQQNIKGRIREKPDDNGPV